MAQLRNADSQDPEQRGGARAVAARDRPLRLIVVPARQPEPRADFHVGPSALKDLQQARVQGFPVDSMQQRRGIGSRRAEAETDHADSVPKEAKQRIVNVSRRIVTAVSTVRSGRRRMVETPMLIAAMMVPKRETSAL